MRGSGRWARRALALGLVGGLGVAIVAASLGCGPLARRLWRSGAERQLAADPIAALPDGLHVALCGAGGPMPDPERSGPCVAVLAGSTLFVVDAGSGGARNLQGPIGWPPGRIAALFLTHYHSDHIDGLGELAMLRWVGAAHREPLPVYGPEGLREVVGGFDRAYRLDAGYRTAHHGDAVAPPDGAGLAAHPFAVPPPGERQPVWQRDGVVVSAFRVDHDPVEPAVGYRFDYGGRSLVLSGDTAKSSSLLEAARGADLIVHEALSAELVGLMQEAAVDAGRTGLAKILSDIPDYHTTPAEAAELAAAAGAHHLLFYHVVPPLPVPGLASVFLEGVSGAFDGGVTLGRDGTRISLPSGSDAIEVDD